MKLPRLFVTVFSMSLRRQMAFRANLLFDVLVAIIGVAAGLVALGIVYTQTRSLGGWSKGEAIVLFGTFEIVSGVRATFIEPNVVWFAEQVKSGKLDDVLLKPVPSVFLVTLGSCAPLALSQVMAGLVVLGIGLSDVPTHPTLGHWICWLVLLGVAIAVTWASRTLVASLSLWSPSLELDVAYGALWQFGRYPVSMYRQPVRFALTYVLPVAVISSVPARALTRSVCPQFLLVWAAAGIATILIVRLVWNHGLRRYTGATS